MAQQPVKELLTLTEAVEAYGFSRTTLMQEVAEHRLIGARKNGKGHWRFRKRDLDAWVDAMFEDYERFERDHQ